MLCEKCRSKLGGSHKYLIEIIRAYKTKDKGVEAMKYKILNMLENKEDMIYELKNKIEELEKRINHLEETP